KEEKPSLFAGLVKTLGSNTRCDATTGLLTVREFTTQLRDALGDETSHGGLLLFGIDGFDLINKTYGYAFGSTVLRVLADRLLALQPEGTLYRMNGDQFAYWQRDASASDLEAMFARFHVTAAGLPTESGTLQLSLTGGYVLYPDHGHSAEALIDHMEIALAKAKEIHPSGLYGYTDAMFRAEEHDHALRAALRREVENHCANFTLLFQPQVYTKKGLCAAAEATLCWNTPEFPDVTPAEYLPILEQTGDIVVVGQWMLRTALEQIRLWQSTYPGLGISVKVSGKQMARQGFAETVCQLVSRYGLPAGTLCLELMPSCRTLPAKTLSQALRTFRAHNITVALDDFGTGLAGFDLLRSLPIQWVKMDRALVRELAVNPADQTILTCLIEMAHRLKIHVNVTGIETEGQRQYATMAGADFLQGHFFAIPLPAQEFAEHVLRELA
ncbi:MAG: EAL domain-containing protein, partial [Gemmiger sp.]